MEKFKYKQFQKEIIIFAVGYYFHYSLSYRDLSEILLDRGIKVHATTIMRWVHEYGEVIYKKWKSKNKKINSSWRLDETYIKIKGVWHYLYRAVDKTGETIDFMLSKKRDLKSAYKFIRNLLLSNKVPRKIVTDKAASIISAIKKLKTFKKYKDIEHKTIKFLNNVIEQDHRHIKRKLPKSSGFQSFHFANSTLSGIETVHAIRKSVINNNHAFSVIHELQNLLDVA